MESELLKELRELFREWLGALSVEEIMSNFEMIELSKLIEERLSKTAA